MIRNTGVEEAQYKWFTVREIDAYGIDEDTVLTVAAPGVLGNDTDVDGDALTAALVSGPANGLLTLNTDGSFSFTPNADFNGSDSFSYMAQDPSLAQSNPATVTLTVNAVNDAPVANSDSATTAEDTAVVIPVLANDVDMDEDALTVTNLTQPANGTATLNADNTVTYTPDSGFTGSDSFIYTAQDPSLAESNPATVTITVNPVHPADTNNDGIVDTPELLVFFEQQLSNTVAEVDDPSRYPRYADGPWVTRSSSDWAAGFFPGALWYMYFNTSDPQWKTWAESWTQGLENRKNDAGTHDIGFVVFNSFGHGYRLTGNSAYKEVILVTADTLASRYDPNVGAIRSWDFGTWEFPVIIDNMMNLEILFWASKNGGGQNLFDIAVNHAYRTRQDHVRADGSTYHVVDYDAAGDIRNKDTWQGYNTESTWARGQAWGLYGFTMAYRETGNLDFLNTAELVADYFVDNLPLDSVPYWDFESPAIPNTDKDSSAAAIAASGLFELSGFEELSLVKRQKYLTAAQDILESLSSSAYLANPGATNAILLHTVGNHGDARQGNRPASEVDVSHIYADMYFIEAVVKNNTGPPTPTITVTNPIENATVSSGPVTIEFDVQNFTIGAVGESHLHYYIDADPTPNMFYNATGCGPEGTCVQYEGQHTHFSHWQSASSIAIFGLSSQSHQVRFALVDANHTELTNPEAVFTLTFTVAQPPTGEFDLDLVADGLNFPVRMAAIPDGRLFYNEMDAGQIRVLDANFNLLPQPFYTFPDILTPGQQGLAGITLDPDFATNGYVYAFYTASSPDRNKVVRLRDVNNQGTQETVIVDNLPTSSDHVSGSIRFGPDGKLYVSIGDNRQESTVQDINFLNGKILRYNKDGSIPRAIAS